MAKKMNAIEKLIAELCPEGVEFKELKKVCIIKTGESVNKIDISQNPGVFPVINSGREPLGFIDKYNTEDDPIGITTRGAGVGSVTWCEGKYFRGNLNYSVTITDLNQLNTRFLYHLLLQDQTGIQQLATYQGIPALNKSNLEKLKVPIPPLAIQQEIVKILDTFTTMEAELEAELEARKKQYKYYRDELLTFGEDVERKELGEVGDFTRGRRFVKNDIVTEGVPCIHYGELYTHYKIWAKKTKSYLEPALAAKLRVAHPGDVVIVAAGETIEDIGNAVAWLGESDVVIHDACFAFNHCLNPKFVSYYLQTNIFRSQIKRYISSGKISSINSSGLSKAKIPIPPLAEQERIVAILDKFDALVNDISVGLPAELNARRKQYEYYRGKLLTFEPLEKEYANP